MTRNLVPVNLAVEDALSDAVLRALIRQTQRYAIGTTYFGGGFGNLRRRIRGFNRAAQGVPLILLTDLDEAVCPPQFMAEWLPEPKSPNLLFRIAVREVESWVLAHGDELAEFLGIGTALVPADPDALADPKGALVQLAQRSRYRELREAIVPRQGGTARIGPAYNSVLSDFVERRWRASVASRRSPSLKSALRAIRSFMPTWR